MEKSTIVSRFASTPEQKTLFAHILDISARAESRNVISSGNFMSENDSLIAENMLSYIGTEKYMIFGGYNDAERRCAVFLPDYFSESDVSEAPELADIIFLKASFDKFDRNAEVSHRDCLGALMALGVEREMIGDILIGNGFVLIIVRQSVSDYIAENLKSIGRYSVTVDSVEKPEAPPKKELTEAFDTVASMRLDGVCAAVFNMSRSGASEAVEHGLVTVNGSVCLKTDMAVFEGDRIALKGKGRVIIGRTEGLSKKGRIRFSYKK